MYLAITWDSQRCELRDVFPVIAGKLTAGITAFILANILAPKLLSKVESVAKKEGDDEE